MKINNSLNRSKIRIYMKLASPNTNDKFKNQFKYAQTIRVLLCNLSNNSENVGTNQLQVSRVQTIKSSV